MPVATSLDDYGRELAQADDDWIIVEASSERVRISYPRSGHTTTLGKDHIDDFTTNPDRSHGGVKGGFLTLKVQLFLQGANLTVRPNVRPSEASRYNERTSQRSGLTSVIRRTVVFSNSLSLLASASRGASTQGRLDVSTMRAETSQ